MKPRLLLTALSASVLAVWGLGHAVAAPITEAAVVSEGADAQSIVSSCATCHGADGASGSAGVPFLAGQHPEYLVAAIRAYVIGERKHDEMRSAVVDLTDVERLAVAKHYRSLSTPWRGAEEVAAPGPVRIDKKAVAAGERISKQCTSCHGSAGISSKPGVPNLAGLQPGYFKQSLRAYLTGERQGAAVMKNFKYSLSKRDIDNLAVYFASLDRKKTKLVAQDNVKAGQQAAGACVGCHGANGNSINLKIPSIAGQNGRYLVNSLQHYRDGQRKNPMMKEAVASLGDKTLRNLASYYSRQTPETLTGDAGTQPGVFDPLGDGRKLAASCDGCHGEQGNGGQRGIPRLTGLAPGYLFAAIRAYRTGERPNETMQMFTASLSDVAIEKVSLFYATQAPTANQRGGKGDVAKGEEVSSACAGCHGEKGVSADPKVPSLAAQDARYLLAALTAYASGQRHSDAMKDAVKELNKQQMQNVAAYYASQTAAKPAVRIPQAPEEWLAKCGRCHGEGGRSVQADKPIIAGQRESYLFNSLREYRDKERIHSTMNAMLGEVSLSEIKALAAYYARQ